MTKLKVHLKILKNQSVNQLSSNTNLSRQRCPLCHEKAQAPPREGQHRRCQPASSSRRRAAVVPGRGSSRVPRAAEQLPLQPDRPTSRPPRRVSARTRLRLRAPVWARPARQNGAGGEEAEPSRAASTALAVNARGPWRAPRGQRRAERTLPGPPSRAEPSGASGARGRLTGALTARGPRSGTPGRAPT